MSFGFNSEVRVGDVVCHVQTECHHAPHPLIETLAYCRGQIIHRRASAIPEHDGTPNSVDDALRLRVENQHRSVMQALETGEILIPPDAAGATSDFSGGIHVRLCNAGSWLRNGVASLDVEVTRADNGHPISAASVEARLEGAAQEIRFAGVTDADGLMRFQFPLPPMKSEAAALVIRATVRAGGDEIRYALRSKAKTQPTVPKS